MPIGHQAVINLVRGLTSSSPSVRSRAADEVTDYITSHSTAYSDTEAMIIAYFLIDVALDEQNPSCPK